MNNHDILLAAMEQSAIDANCSAMDFSRAENVIAYSKKNPAARRYLELPLACNLISYGNNVVASIESKYEEIVRAYIEKYPRSAVLKHPICISSTAHFRRMICRSAFMAEYFLPDMTQITPSVCPYPLKTLTAQDFSSLYVPNGQMHSVKSAGSWTFWGSAHTTAIDCRPGRLLGRLRHHVANRGGCASRVSTQRNRFRPDIETWPGNPRSWENPFLLLRMGEQGSARNAIRSGFRPRLDRNDDKIVRLCG